MKKTAMKRANVHSIIYLMMVFLETTYKAKYFRFQGDWQTASLALQELSKTDFRSALKGSTLPHTVIWQIHSSYKPSQSMTLMNLNLIWKH